MKRSAKMAALALGFATLSGATILPAKAMCIMQTWGYVTFGDCGSAAAGAAAAAMGSGASAGSAGSAGGGGSSSYDQVLAGLGLPPPETLRSLAELQKEGLYYNYGYEKRGEPTFIGPDGHFTPDGVDPPVHYGGDGRSDKKDENNEAKVLKPSQARASTVTVNVNANRNAPPTATVSASAFGGAVSHAVSQAAVAPKKPVTMRTIPASTQAHATAHQPVARSQPIGPVGSSSMSARQSALSAGSR